MLVGIYARGSARPCGVQAWFAMDKMRALTVLVSCRLPCIFADGNTLGAVHSVPRGATCELHFTRSMLYDESKFHPAAFFNDTDNSSKNLQILGA